MKRVFTAVALTIIVLVSVLTVSFAHSGLFNSPEQKPTFDTASPANVTSSTPSGASGEEDNSTSASSQQISSPNCSSTSFLTSAAVNASALSSPAHTQEPEPNFASDSAYPEGIKDWLPWGSFGMFSPANQTYAATNLVLNVTGGVISGDAYAPVLSYSLDGGQRVLVPITLTKPEGLDLTFQRVISGSIALPPLSNGSHVIVLYGDLGFDSKRGKVTVYFEVQTG